jgi:hypothetical protein
MLNPAVFRREVEVFDVDGSKVTDMDFSHRNVKGFDKVVESIVYDAGPIEINDRCQNNHDKNPCDSDCE